MLDRPYSVVEPHTEYPAAGSEASALKAGTYSELVSDVLYLVSQCRDSGTVQLVDYEGDVEADLNRACLEVANDDPLGAYAVDFIKYDYTRILTAYEVGITISYRRTLEQIRSLVNVTGTSAIRQEVRDALTELRPELVLRVGYFTEDEETIAALVRQTYYEDSSALGMPELAISLYPDSGTQRVVEIVLTYPYGPETLHQMDVELSAAIWKALLPLHMEPAEPAELVQALLDLPRNTIRRNGAPNEDGSPRSTAWDALVGEGADSEGVALAFRLLCAELELNCQVTSGTLDEAPRFWNTLVLDGETVQIDMSSQDPQLMSSEDFAGLGYDWPGRPELPGPGETIPEEGALDAGPPPAGG